MSTSILAKGDYGGKALLPGSILGKKEGPSGRQGSRAKRGVGFGLRRIWFLSGFYHILAVRSQVSSLTSLSPTFPIVEWDPHRPVLTYMKLPVRCQAPHLSLL